MNITVKTPAAPFGSGVIRRIDDDTAALVPWHIKFEVHDLKWFVEGVIFTDMEDPDPQPKVIKLTVTPKPGGPDIGAAMGRELHYEDIKRQAIHTAAVRYQRDGSVFKPVDGPAHKTTAKLATGAAPGSRIRDFNLVAAAKAYRDAQTAERPGHDTSRRQLLAAVKNECQVSMATAGRWIAEARRRGFLEQEIQS